MNSGLQRPSTCPVMLQQVGHGCCLQFETLCSGLCCFVLESLYSFLVNHVKYSDPCVVLFLVRILTDIYHLKRSVSK